MENTNTAVAPKNGAATSTAINILTSTDLQSAGSVFTQGQSWVEKYKNKQIELLEKVEENGEKLTPQLDEELTKWQVSAKKAAKAISEQRKPFTEKAHAFVKAFTTLENELLKDLYEPVQLIRNKSAAIYAEEAKKAKEAEEKKLREAQKRIEEVSKVENELRQGYATILRQDKDELMLPFEGMTIENSEKVAEFYKGVEVEKLPAERWKEIVLTGTEEINTEVKTQEKYEACSAHYTNEINALAAHLLEQVPARVKEIEKGIEENKIAEKQRKEALKAAEEAEEKAKKEAEKAKEKAELAVKVSQANREAEKPQAIQKYQIEVKNIDGWRRIADFYFHNTELESDELGKVKLDSMKLFAERKAKSDGILIESDDLIYKPIYKAVARARKGAK